MGTYYTAFIFIGAEVADRHFFTLGEETRTCQNHGVQTKKFCGDCGRETWSSHEKLWTPKMLKAAENLKISPEVLWEEMSPDEEPLYYDHDHGKFGRWGYGYNSESVLFGAPIAKARAEHGGFYLLNPSEITDTIASVKGKFKAYGIEAAVEVVLIQDCG